MTRKTCFYFYASLYTITNIKIFTGTKVLEEHSLISNSSNASPF